MKKKQRNILAASATLLTSGAIAATVLATQVNRKNNSGQIKPDNLDRVMNYTIRMNDKNYSFQNKVDAMVFLEKNNVIKHQKVILSTNGLKKFRKSDSSSNDGFSEQGSNYMDKSFVLDEGDVIDVDEGSIESNKQSLTMIVQAGVNQKYFFKTTRGDEDRFREISRKLSQNKYGTSQSFNLSNDDYNFYAKYKKKTDSIKNKARLSLLNFTDIYEFNGKLFRSKQDIFFYILGSLEIGKKSVLNSGKAENLLKVIRGVYTLHLFDGETIDISISSPTTNQDFSLSNNKLNSETISQYIKNNAKIFLENGDEDIETSEDLFESEVGVGKNEYIHLSNTHYKSKYFVSLSKDNKYGKLYGDSFIELKDSTKLSLMKAKGSFDAYNWKQSKRKELPQEQVINNALSNVISAKFDSYLYAYSKRISTSSNDGVGDPLKALLEIWLGINEPQISSEVNDAFEIINNSKINTLNKFWTSYSMIVNRMIDLKKPILDIAKLANAYKKLAKFVDAKIWEEVDVFAGDQTQDAHAKIFSALPFDDLSRFDAPTEVILPILETGDANFSEKQSITRIKNEPSKTFNRFLLKTLTESDLMSQIRKNDIKLKNRETRYWELVQEDKESNKREPRASVSNYPVNQVPIVTESHVSEEDKEHRMSNLKNNTWEIKSRGIYGISFSNISTDFDSDYINYLNKRIKNYNSSIKEYKYFDDIQEVIGGKLASADVGVIINALKMNRQEAGGSKGLIKNKKPNKLEDFILPFDIDSEIKSLEESFKTSASTRTDANSKRLSYLRLRSSIYKGANNKIQELLGTGGSETIKTLKNILNVFYDDSQISDLKIQELENKLLNAIRGGYFSGKTASLFSGKNQTIEENMKIMPISKFDSSEGILESFSFNDEFNAFVSETFKYLSDIAHLYNNTSKIAKKSIFIYKKLQPLAKEMESFKKLTRMMERFRKSEKILSKLKKFEKIFSAVGKLKFAIPVVGEFLMIGDLVLSTVVDLFGKHNEFAGSEKVVYSYDVGEGHIYYWDGGLKTWSFWGIFGDDVKVDKKALKLNAPLKIISSRTSKYYFGGEKYDSVSKIQHYILREKWKKFRDAISNDTKVKVVKRKSGSYLIFSKDGNNSMGWDGVKKERFLLKLKLNKEAFDKLEKTSNIDWTIFRNISEFSTELISILDKNKPEYQKNDWTSDAANNKLITSARLAFGGKSQDLIKMSPEDAAQEISDWLLNSETVEHKVLVTEGDGSEEKIFNKYKEKFAHNDDILKKVNMAIIKPINVIDDASFKEANEAIIQLTKNWELTKFEEGIIPSRIIDALMMDSEIDSLSIEEIRKRSKTYDVFKVKLLTNDLTSNSIYKYYTDIRKALKDMEEIYSGRWIEKGKVVVHPQEVYKKEEENV